MHIFTSKKQLEELLNKQKEHIKSIGFVPTMGALHQGHLSLISRAISENQIVVVSIFVNPTQFNNAEDLQKYPRTLEQDIEKIKSLEQEVILYTPQACDVYTDQIKAEDFDFDGLEHKMEGAFRPGHFNGVGTIVKTLFEIVKPDRAYFGEKDFQQLQIIKKLVEKKQIPVTVIGCPILREAHGLAMSSRNERLDPVLREKAAFLHQTLLKAKVLFGTKSAIDTIAWVEAAFDKNTDFVLEYFTIAEEKTLESITEKKADKKYRAFLAVYANKIRLIDNIALN